MSTASPTKAAGGVTGNLLASDTGGAATTVEAPWPTDFAAMAAAAGLRL